MMVFAFTSLEAAQAEAHRLAERLRTDIGVWEEPHWSLPHATHVIKVPAERRHCPYVDGATYVAVHGDVTERSEPIA